MRPVLSARLRVKNPGTNSRSLFYGGVRLIEVSIKRESTVLISSTTFGTCNIFHLIIQVNFSLANFECPFDKETEKKSHNVFKFATNLFPTRKVILGSSK